MTVQFLTGFDLFGSANNAAGDGPLQGAGLTNQPSKPTLSTAGTAGRTYIGVSDLEKFKMGSGANKRNAMVIWNTGTAVSDGATNVSFPILPNIPFANLNARAVIGFRFKKQKTNLAGPYINAWYPLLLINGVVIFNVNLSGNVMYVGNTTSQAPFTFIDGQEYYVEIEVERSLAAATNSLRYRMYIDGVRYGADAFGNPSSITSIGWQAPAGNYNWNVATSICDVYIATDRLGPQMVLSRQPTVTLVQNWTPSEGTDGLALITGANSNNDAKYIISPPSGTAEDRFRLDFDIPAGYQAQAAALFVRGKRAEASTRRIKAAVFNQATGEEILPASSLSIQYPQNAYETNLLWNSMEAGPLTRSVLNNLAISLTSPLS